MSETVELKTIEDISNVVTEENIVRFLNDFALHLAFCLDVKRKFPKTVVKSMHWTDDGNHDITGAIVNGELIQTKKKP